MVDGLFPYNFRLLGTPYNMGESTIGENNDSVRGTKIPLLAFRRGTNKKNSCTLPISIYIK
ncbi:DUF214 domain-containing protein [Sesbania bispinosa]|nr:DUF214 domain-containing protein [Sesbania bispinosa]